jgi:hypothetical protein
MNTFGDDNKSNTQHDDFSARTDGFNPVGEDALKGVSGGGQDVGGAVDAAAVVVPKLVRQV